MKKEHLLIAAAAIFAISSCTKEESAVNNTPQIATSTDVINFTTNTTRAETMELSDILGDETGFEVFATQSNSDGSTTWLINSDYYKYNTTNEEWEWKTSNYAWPTTTDEFPVTFYAVYASDLSGVTTASAAASDLSKSTPATVAITIAEPAKQVDLLATATAADSKPLDGKLSICLDHVLTKIDFGIITGSDRKVYLGAFQLNNLEYEGTYDIDASEWAVTSTSGDAEYPLTDFTPVNGEEGNESTAISFTNTEDEYSLMLLPQTTTEWDVENWDGTAISETHIEMNFRMTDANDSDFFGYTYAIDYPGYESDNPEHIEYAEEALYLKVGYPLSTTWASDYNYTYNIKLGTEFATNGYLLDDYYYDEEGEKTPFPIEIDKEIGEPLSDGNIHFDVSVCGWSDDNATSTIE
ncbi:MAG: hypothetical protein SNH35_05935 [Rikenellaceae bacterium]